MSVRPILVKRSAAAASNDVLSVTFWNITHSLLKNQSCGALLKSNFVTHFFLLNQIYVCLILKRLSQFIFWVCDMFSSHTCGVCLISLSFSFTRLQLYPQKCDISKNGKTPSTAGWRGETRRRVTVTSRLQCKWNTYAWKRFSTLSTIGETVEFKGSDMY